MDISTKISTSIILQPLYIIICEKVKSEKKVRVSFTKQENLGFAYLTATLLVQEVELKKRSRD